jgi:hypothetical protein
MHRVLGEANALQQGADAVGLGERARAGPTWLARSGIGTYDSAALAGTLSHSLASSSCKHAKTTRPPGRNEGSALLDHGRQSSPPASAADRTADGKKS